MVEDKPIEFADEETPVIIHDELAEIEAEDPTFGGIREGARMDEAYVQVDQALREAYMDRFQHTPPADLCTLFEELNEEVIIPEQDLIARLLRMKKEQIRFTEKEEKKLLSVMGKFLKGIKNASHD